MEFIRRAIAAHNAHRQYMRSYEEYGINHIRTLNSRHAFEEMLAAFLKGDNPL